MSKKEKFTKSEFVDCLRVGLIPTMFEISNDASVPTPMRIAYFSIANALTKTLKMVEE